MLKPYWKLCWSFDFYEKPEDWVIRYADASHSKQSAIFTIPAKTRLNPLFVLHSVTLEE